MTTLNILTNDGIDATASVEAGRHGGDALVIRDGYEGQTLLAVKVEHVSDVVLSSLLDPGTVTTVRETFGL